MRTALSLLRSYRSLDSGRFRWKEPPYEYEYEKLPFDILCGDPAIRSKIEQNTPIDKIELEWLPSLEKFQKTRQQYLLYN